MTLLFANNAQATIAGPLTPTTTTINLAAGTGVLFPSPGSGQYFKLTLIDAATRTLYEICNVTARATDTLTVVRAQEGTTGLSWNTGDICANLPTAGSFGAFAQTASLASSFYTGTDNSTSGAPNAVTVPTLSPTLATPAVGQLFLITKSAYGNTGAVTVQLNSGTVYSAVYKDGSALGNGDWPAGSSAFLVFTGGVFQYLANQGGPGVRGYASDDTGTADALVATPSPPALAYADKMVVYVKKGTSANATTTPTLAVSGLAPTVITRLDGSAVAAGDLLPGAELPLKYDADTSRFRLLWPVTPTQVPIIVPAGTATTLYFGGAGASDSNPGTMAAPFVTIGALLSYGLSRYSLSGGTLIAQMNATGSYAMPTVIPPTVGTVVIQGVSGNIAASIVTSGGISASGSVIFQGVALQNTSSTQSTILSQAGGNIVLQSGTTLTLTGGGSSIGVSTGPGGSITINGLTASGSGQSLFSVTGGQILIGAAPVAITGSPTYSGAFVQTSVGGVFFVEAGASFTGSVSGPQYTATTNSVIQSAGLTFPGSSAGVLSSGAQHV